MRPAQLPRVLTAAGADRLEITRSAVRTELRRQRWHRLAPGVYLTRPDEPLRVDWVEAGLVLGGPGAAVSGWDVVRMHSLGPSTPPRESVLVLVSTGRSRVVGQVQLRRSERPLRARTATLPSGDRAPVAAVARAVADTALLLTDVNAVRALVTDAVQRRLCTPEQVLSEYRSGPRNGSGLLRRVLDDVLRGARSVAEVDASRALRRCRLVPPFEMNAPIVDGGRQIAVADFLWRSLRAVLEIDSREFHFSEVDWKATMVRHNRLTRMGYAVAHYPPSEVRRRPTAWATEVADWLSRRAAELRTLIN